MFQNLQQRYDETKSKYNELHDVNKILQQELQEALVDNEEKSQLKNEWEREILYVQNRIKEIENENNGIFGIYIILELNNELQ